LIAFIADSKIPTPGDKLIEVEKSETGSVSWQVYKHYLVSIGIFAVIITVLMNMLFQAFSIGSNVWLGTSEQSTNRNSLLIFNFLRFVV